MVKPLKIILSIVAGLVLLILVAVSAAVFLVDLNHFKPEITAAVKNKIGRDLVIDGDLKLAFFPALGLTTGKMTLSNAPEFPNQAFATLEDSHINVELLPLLSKKIEVQGIVFTGLTLNLITNQQGVKNWQDLMARKTTPAVTTNAPSPQQLTTAALGTFAISNVSLVDAQINWQNLKTGKNMLIKDLNLKTDKIVFDQPIVIDGAFVMGHETYKLTTSLVVNEKHDTFAFGHSQIQTTIPVLKETITYSLAMNDGTLSLPEQTFKVSGLQIKSDDLILTADLSAEHFMQDDAVIQGTVNLAPFNFKKERTFPVPALCLEGSKAEYFLIGSIEGVAENPNAFNKLAVSFAIKANKNAVDLQNLVLNVDDTTITGSLNTAPTLTANLAIDNVDIDRYLPPVEKNKKPITSPTLALTAGAAAIPVETLKTLNANVNLAIAKLKINDLNLQDAQLHFVAKNGVVTSTQTIKQFYQGEYTGNLVIDARPAQPVLAIDEKLSRVQVEPLLQDFKGKAFVRGTVDIAAHLQGQGRTAAELKSSLKGFLKFACQDGAIIGFNLHNMIDKGKALLKGVDLTAANNDQTPFLTISGTAAIDNGLINNQDLLAKTTKLQVNGQGTANLVTEQLDYKLTSLLLKEKATPTEAEQFHDTPVVINIGGTFSKPTYNLDVAALLTEKNKAKIEQVLDTIKTDENKAKIEHALDKLKPEEKEKVKQLAPKLGKLFKKLF